MTSEDAVLWIAYACRQPVEDVRALRLEDDQAVTLAQWLSARGVINPMEPRPIKSADFTCACCGTTFHREYRTSKPKYCSRTCQQKAYRRRQREKHHQTLTELRGRPTGLIPTGNGRTLKLVRELTA